MFKKTLSIFLSFLTVVFTLNISTLTIAANAKNTTLNISVVTNDENNDLLKTLLSNYNGVKHYKSLDDALNSASADKTKGIMVLADKYPDSTTAITDSQASKVKASGIRLYIEYPLNNATLGITGYTDAQTMGFDRAVVTNADKLGMAENSILYVHGAKYKAKPYSSATWLANATVAGYDTADFGLTDCTPYSMLETNGEGNVLIASTKLSQFITARYAPYERWQKLWLAVISWVSGTSVTDISWTPLVKSSYGKTQKLSDAAYTNAVDLSTKWYINNMIPSDKKGVYQCFMSGSYFDELGNQAVNEGVRADCTAESVGAIALAGALLNNNEYRDTAYSIMKWMLNSSEMANGKRADPSSSQYGLFDWYNNSDGSYYGDDNAKAIIGLILAASALETDEFDQRILEAIIANFRTAGQNGFRGSVLTDKDFEDKDWESLFNSNTKNYASHFESLLWACYLWAYNQTGYEPLLTRTKTALTMMMASYIRTMDETDQYFASDKWNWTNSLQADRAKLILPLAWLVRVEPTDEHIKWLDLIVTDMMSTQDAATGAIRDTVGEEWQGKGSCGPFTKNSEYGTHESPVIQQNGDPCTDCLYTSNFAVMSLNEAYAAVKSAKNSTLTDKYQKYVKTASDYLVKIQQVSSDTKYNGVWFRGFDYEKWESYGSDGDAGWGIWCTETGWTQSFISYSLSLQSMGTNMWDYTSHSAMGKCFSKVEKSMLNYSYSMPNYQPDLTLCLSIINGVIGTANGDSPSGNGTDGSGKHNTADGNNTPDDDGTINADDDVFVIDDDTTQKSNKGKNNLWLWIASAFIAVGLIAASAFAYIKLLHKGSVKSPIKKVSGEACDSDIDDDVTKTDETTTE